MVAECRHVYGRRDRQAAFFTRHAGDALRVMFTASELPVVSYALPSFDGQLSTGDRDHLDSGRRKQTCLHKTRQAVSLFTYHFGLVVKF